MAAGNVETSQRVTDVVLGALAQAAPELIPAASSGTMNNLSFGGVDPRTRAFAYYETIAGGMGASSRGRRVQRDAHAHDQYAEHADRGVRASVPGARGELSRPARLGRRGAHRGGDGIVRELRFLVPAEVTILSDRRERGPWGLGGRQGGEAGKKLRWCDGKPARTSHRGQGPPGSACRAMFYALRRPAAAVGAASDRSRFVTEPRP